MRGFFIPNGFGISCMDRMQQEWLALNTPLGFQRKPLTSVYTIGGQHISEQSNTMFTAKVRVNAYRCEMHATKIDQSGPWTEENLVSDELRTVEMSLSQRVEQPQLRYSTINLGTINLECWKHFKLGSGMKVHFVRTSETVHPSGAVIAKFVVDNYETNPNRFKESPNDEDQIRTVTLRPVYGDKDAKSENSKFWKWTPAGEIKLSLKKQEDWGQFPHGEAMYVIFEEDV